MFQRFVPCVSTFRYPQWGNEMLSFFLSLLFLLLPLFIPLNTFAGVTKEDSRAQQLSEAQAVVSRGERLSAQVAAMKTQARNEKDILRVNCLNTKLSEINANLRTAKARLNALRNETDPQRRMQAHNVMIVLGQKFDVLEQQASQCIGQAVFESGSSKAPPPSESQQCPPGKPVRCGKLTDFEGECKTRESECNDSFAPAPPPPSLPIIAPPSVGISSNATIVAKEGIQEVKENAGTPLIFTVSLDPAASKDLSIPYTITGVDANDLEKGLSGNIPITTGATTTDLELAVNDDNVYEEDETFTITLGPAPDSVTLEDKKSATGTIQNDDLVSKSSVAVNTEAKVVKKVMSIKPKGDKTEYKKGTDTEIIFTVTLICPDGYPAECSANECAKDETNCPAAPAKPKTYSGTWSAGAFDAIGSGESAKCGEGRRGRKVICFNNEGNALADDQCDPQIKPPICR